MGGLSLSTKGKITSPGTGGTGPKSGQVEIEPNLNQLITLPMQYGYWDNITHQIIRDVGVTATFQNCVIDQIEDIMSSPAENFIEIAYTYLGDSEMFKVFIPGFTDSLTSQNFQLAYDDGGKIEYTALWLKSIHSSPIILDWKD